MSEIEWPLLPRGDKLAMVTVEEYRDQATVHLNARNVYVTSDIFFYIIFMLSIG